MASSSVLQILLKKGWKPSLTVKGLSGLPEAAVAGNLMLPEVILGISLSLPPSFKEEGAEIFIKDLLTKNTPFKLFSLDLRFIDQIRMECHFMLALARRHHQQLIEGNILRKKAFKL